MKKTIAIILITSLSLVLSGCSEVVNEAYGYNLSRESNYSCATAIEEVYQTDGYIYYFGCLESQFYTIADSSGNEYDIYQILEDNLLTIEEIYDLFDGHLSRMKNEDIVANSPEYLDFDIDNMVITNLIIRVDDGGFYNWPFESTPENYNLEINYSAIMDDIKTIISSVDGARICNLGPLGCVVFGPMPAFSISINDGIHYYTLSIELGSWEDNDYISNISLMEGEETKLTIPSANLLDEYEALYNFINSSYNDYVSSAE